MSKIKAKACLFPWSPVLAKSYSKVLMKWIARCFITLFSLTYKQHLVILKGLWYMFLSIQNSQLPTTTVKTRRAGKTKTKTKTQLDSYRKILQCPLVIDEGGHLPGGKPHSRFFISKITRICYKYLSWVMKKSSLFMKDSRGQIQHLWWQFIHCRIKLHSLIFLMYLFFYIFLFNYKII